MDKKDKSIAEIKAIVIGTGESQNEGSSEIHVELYANVTDGI